MIKTRPIMNSGMLRIPTRTDQLFSNTNVLSDWVLRQGVDYQWNEMSQEMEKLWSYEESRLRKLADCMHLQERSNRRELAWNIHSG